MTSSQGQGGGEPLSEEERRVLEEIERTFHLQDPSFSTRLRSETVYRHAGRACSWGIAVFLVGLALLVSTFTVSVVLGALGFVVMLGASIYLERHLRRLGRAGWQELSQSMRRVDLSQTWGQTRHRLRDRFRRP